VSFGDDSKGFQPKLLLYASKPIMVGTSEHETNDIKSGLFKDDGDPWEGKGRYGSF